MKRIPNQSNDSPRQRAASAGSSRPWLWLILAACLSPCLTGCLRVNSDTAALRDGVLASLPADWNKEFEIGIGWITLSAARAGLSFVDLPPEAKSALTAFSGADVGIYRCTSMSRHPDLGKLVENTECLMAKRGWDRLVTVTHAREVVTIFVPQTLRSSRNVKACVLVLQPRQMIVVSASGDLQPLMGLAFNSAQSYSAK